ncbi:MAG: 2-oxoacid:acceptor oxidoreductase family protein [Firmicutes bacterium]|nr:2-oxoacid:acceptor oxidoreductase family protein [Bacillota bacterium]
MSRYEIRMAGVGGQGLILAGQILAEAAAIFGGKYAVQTQSYAPLARGAPSKSEIIIDTEEVDYPKVEVPDLLLVLSQDAYEKHIKTVKDDTVIIVNSNEVNIHGESGTDRKSMIHKVPLEDLSRSATGKNFAASIAALGFISCLTGIVSIDSLKMAIEKRAPKGTVEINIKALEEGFKACS